MNEDRDIEDQLKITDADREAGSADRTESGMNPGSGSTDARQDNTGVLGDVAHPFDQTNGILDDYDETHPGNVTGESAGEYAASADPVGTDASTGDTGDTGVENDTPFIPGPLPPAFAPIRP